MSLINKADNMTDSYNELRNIANQVRNIELQTLLLHLGARQDQLDKKKWHTLQGCLSITPHQFMNWKQQVGGGGAIDLIMHLRQCDFKSAVLYLAHYFLPAAVQSKPNINYSCHKIQLQLPARNEQKLPPIKSYLTDVRGLPLSLINPLIKSGRLYADSRSNAVFLLLGKEKIIVGAELRGTGASCWRGMAKGSNKNSGGFYVTGDLHSNKIILCESAIDSMSCVVLNACYMAISTSGAAPNPFWLKRLTGKGYDIYCGFDADETGDKLAEKMISIHPSVKRLRPQRHDWNDLLNHSSSIK